MRQRIRQPAIDGETPIGKIPDPRSEGRENGLDKAGGAGYDCRKERNITKKRLILTAAIILVAALSVSAFAGCYGDKDYFVNLDAYGFWDNEPEQAIAQPK